MSWLCALLCDVLFFLLEEKVWFPWSILKIALMKYEVYFYASLCSRSVHMSLKKCAIEKEIGIDNIG